VLENLEVKRDADAVCLSQLRGDAWFCYRTTRSSVCTGKAALEPESAACSATLDDDDVVLREFMCPSLRVFSTRGEQEDGRADPGFIRDTPLNS